METHRDYLQRPTETTCRDLQRPPAETTLVSHLPCPLPPNHLQRPAETTCRDPRRHLKFDWSIFPTTFNDIIGTDFDWLISPPPMETTHGDPQRLPAETHRDHLQRPAETTCGNHISQSFALPPATKPVSHSFALPPATKPPAETTCGNHISQSFALPPATKPVSHSFALPPATKPPAETTHRYPQRPHVGDPSWRPPTEITCRDPWRLPRDLRRPPTETTLVSHLPCPLPPNQSDHSFALPPATKPPMETHRDI